MSKIPVALQLYSIREDCAKDLPSSLASVSRMGYEGVEFAGYYGYSASDLRKMLDDNGLRCAGTHTGIETIAPENLQQTIDFNKTLGNRFLIVPGLPAEMIETRAAWLKTAEKFGQASSAARKQDMYVGYHNHHIEFQPLDGEMPWDTFFSNTPPEVIMQLDTGNALVGGADPVPFLKRYPGRALTVHLKEHSGSNDTALIGEGDVDWPSVFDLCENHGGVQWYIVEQESYAFPPMECVDKCLQRLRAMGK